MDNPIELLALAAIYEFKGEPRDTEPYWWVIEGANIWHELDAALPSFEEQQKKRSYWEDEDNWEPASELPHKELT